MKPEILVLCGPTASGKSDLAVCIAKKINGEIISADSRQVYKGLDIGTGKVPRDTSSSNSKLKTSNFFYKGVPHHLLDIYNPKKKFSVVLYKKLAEKAINDILSRNKVPIICGGTAFYIDTLVNNTTLPEVEPNEKLRVELEGMSLEKLMKILLKLDPNRAKTIDQKNKVRIIRAIEIAKALGKVPKVKSNAIYRSIWIGITWPNDELKKRIHARLLSRIKKGMIKEVANLHKKGLSWKRMEELGLEYRYISLFLQKKISRDEMIEKLNTEILHYAKRQMTWFKRNKEIRWFSLKDKNIILKSVEKFI